MVLLLLLRSLSPKRVVCAWAEVAVPADSAMMVRIVVVAFMFGVVWVCGCFRVVQARPLIADSRETFSGITITQEGSGDDTKRTMNVMFERPFFSSALKRLFREHTKYELNFAELQCLRDAFPSMKRVG